MKFSQEKKAVSEARLGARNELALKCGGWGASRRHLGLGERPHKQLERREHTVLQGSSVSAHGLRQDTELTTTWLSSCAQFGSPAVWCL